MSQEDQENVISFISKKELLEREHKVEYANILRDIADRMESGEIEGVVCVVVRADGYEFLTRGVSIERQVCILQRQIHRAMLFWDRYQE